jgi:hypothetical protein
MKIILMSLLLFSLPAFADLRMGNIDIMGFEKYPEQEKNIHDALIAMEEVINSEEFRERVLNYRDGKGFTTTKLTPAEVYATIMKGKEKLEGEMTEGEINFDVKRWRFFYRYSVVAESDPGKTNTIRTSEWFYSRYDAAEIAGNLTHEWIHLLGFTHANANDHDSVPYAVGYIMRELAKNQ